MEKIIRKGFMQCMQGKTSWINTQSDEMIKMDFKNRPEQLNWYCKFVKVTIEEITQSEYNEIFLNLNEIKVVK
jgi:hypothetical protein